MNINRLLVHPVRARIIGCLGGRRLTRQQLAELIPETPAISIYRNLRVLLDAGLVETVERIPRRGVEEHVYALKEGGANVEYDEATRWSKDQWQQGLDTFLQQISASYRAYLASGGDQPCPANGRVLYLSDAEIGELGRKVGDVLDGYDAAPGEGRRRYVFSAVYQPDDRSKSA
ncbi:MAG TPA: helix-turn-helix domain-containing protein [Fimbriimonas sp.]